MELIDLIIHPKNNFIQKQIILLACVLGFLFYINTASFMEIYQNKLKNEFTSKSQNEFIGSNFIIKNNQIDYYSDCILLSVGLINKGNNIFNQTISAPSIFGCNELKDFLIDSVIPQDFEILKNNLGFKNYGRYWHGSQIFTKPLILIGGLKAVAIVTMLLALLTYLLFIFISFRKLRFNSLYLLFPFLVYFNLNQFLLITHLVPILIPLLLSSILLMKDFKISKSRKYVMFLSGFYWWFFSYLVNPILLIAIPVSAFIVYSEVHSLPVKTKLKTVFSIIIFPSLGLLSSIFLKSILLLIVRSNEIQNFRDSNYWRFPITFEQSWQNINFYNNMTLYWWSVLILVLTCSVRISDINFYFYVFLFALGLLYPILLKSHTMHNFSGASSYPIIVASFLILRFIVGFFGLNKPLYSYIRLQRRKKKS